MQEFLPTVLTTPRLRLRLLELDDAEGLFSIFADPEVTRYWSSEPWDRIEQALDSVEQTLSDYAQGSALRFAIERVERPGIIGTVSLNRFVDACRRCEVGYALARPYWSQGYVGEALRAVLDYGFRKLDLNRVEADVDPGNVASDRVLERLGFRREGHMPERWIVQGHAADTVFYGLLRRHYEHA
jgi:RimJ/RimL family protein N-acetyltransferase